MIESPRDTTRGSVAIAELELAQELLQLVVAALDIADSVAGHDRLEASIQPPVLYCFRHVLRPDARGAGQVGDGAGDTQHTVVGARGEQ